MPNLELSKSWFVSDKKKKTVKECETACGAYDATKLNIMARASIFCWHTKM